LREQRFTNTFAILSPFVWIIIKKYKLNHRKAIIKLENTKENNEVLEHIIIARNIKGECKERENQRHKLIFQR